MLRKITILLVAMLALLPAVAHATLRTVSKGGIGFTTATYTTGVAGVNTAIQNSAPGDTVQIVEPGTYSDATMALTFGTTRTAYTVTAVPGVQILNPTGQEASVSASKVLFGTSCTLNVNNVNFVTTGGTAATVFNISESTGALMNVNLNNSHIWMLNGVSNQAGLFVGGVLNANALTGTIGNQAQVKALNLNITSCSLRHSGTSRAALDFRNSYNGTATCNVNLNLLNSSVSAEVAAGGGVATIDFNGGVYNCNLNISTCTVQGTGTTRPVIGAAGTTTARFCNNNVTITNTSIKSLGAHPVRFDDSATTTNNVGGNTWTFNRCIIDNTLSNASQKECIDINETNGTGPIAVSALNVYNSLLISSKQGNTSTNSRCIVLANFTKLVSYNNTFMSTAGTSPNATGASAIGFDTVQPLSSTTAFTAAQTSATYVSKNSIFFNFRNPIGGTISTQTTNTETNAIGLTPGQTDTNNIIVGPSDDTELGASRTFVFNATPLNYTSVIRASFKPFSGSQAVDSADQSVVGTIGAQDLSGAARVVNGLLDVGAYEFVPSPNAAGHWTAFQ